MYVYIYILLILNIYINCREWRVVNLLNVCSNKSQMCFAIKVFSVCPTNFTVYCCYFFPVCRFLCILANLWHQIYCVNSHVKYFVQFSKHLSSVLLLTEVSRGRCWSGAVADTKINYAPASWHIKCQKFQLKIKMANLYLCVAAVSNKFYSCFG